MNIKDNKTCICNILTKIQLLTAKLDSKIVKESLEFINIIEYVKINWYLTQFSQKIQNDKTF